MINEWISTHKKQATIIAVAALIALSIVVGLLSWLFGGSKEEEEALASVRVSDISVLYDNFSDYTIGYVLNAIDTSLTKNESMKDGQTAGAKEPSADATDEQLYPGTHTGDFVITIKDNKVSETEDSWGSWKTFTITVNDGRLFKVDVGLAPNNSDNSVGYTKISVTKL